VCACVCDVCVESVCLCVCGEGKCVCVCVCVNVCGKFVCVCVESVDFFNVKTDGAHSYQCAVEVLIFCIFQLGTSN